MLTQSKMKNCLVFHSKVDSTVVYDDQKNFVFVCVPFIEIYKKAKQECAFFSFHSKFGLF